MSNRDRFINRAKEPSTYAGLAAILYGVAEVFRVKEVAPLADIITEAGTQVATTGSPVVGIAGILAGLLSIVLKENK